MTDYEKFYQLHHQSKPFTLPNVWNVKSAQIIENSGFEAMATSSGAIAESLGYKDGEQISFDEMLYVVRRIKACTSLPLSVDIERGYTDDVDVLIKNIQKLINVGVVGINLEDAQGEYIFLKKLAAVKKYFTQTKQHLFINARTDGFLQKLDSPLEVTLRRARLYKDAGADGLFITGVQATEIIKRISSSTTLPVNVVGIPKNTSLASLAEAGVKRISMAVLLYKATYRKMETIAAEIAGGESFQSLA